MQNQQMRIPIPRELMNKIKEAEKFIKRADVLRVITTATMNATIANAVLTTAHSYLGNPSSSTVQISMAKTALGLATAAIINGYERICRQKGIAKNSNVERELNQIVIRHQARARARARQARAIEARAREARAREARAREARARERRAIDGMVRRGR